MTNNSVTMLRDLYNDVQQIKKDNKVFAQAIWAILNKKSVTIGTMASLNSMVMSEHDKKKLNQKHNQYKDNPEGIESFPNDILWTPASQRTISTKQRDIAPKTKDQVAKGGILSFVTFLLPKSFNKKIPPVK